MGIVLAARDFDFSQEVVVAVNDVLDVCPLVKFAVPGCSDAQKLMKQGRAIVKKVREGGGVG